MKTRKCIICLAVITVLSCFLSIFSFAESDSPVENIVKNNSPILISKNGDTKNFPENTLNAVKGDKENGADACLIDVALSKDGKFVCINEDDFPYILVDEKKSKIVGDYTLAELKNLEIRTSRGGHFAKKSNEKIASLDSLLEFSVKENYPLVLNVKSDIAADCYKIIKEKNAQKTSVLFINDLKPKDYSRLFPDESDRPDVFTFVKSNVIFTVNSFINSAGKNNIDGVCLASRVPYSVSFMKRTTEKLEEKNMRSIIDLTQSDYCGKIRQDSTIWFDELLDRGFDTFLTDDCGEFKDHLEKIKEQTAIAERTLNEMSGLSLPNQNNKKMRELVKKYNTAVEDIKSSLSSTRSLSFVIGATKSLQESYEEINRSYDAIMDGSVGTTVTSGRIVVAVLSIAFVVCLEIFIYKYKKKK